MLDKSKESIIAKVYYDPAGYGSINSTLKDAKVYDKSITYEDVKQWKERNVERKTQLKGQNSFVTSYPRQEYQMDLFFLSDLKDQVYPLGLLMVDIFSKYISIIPLKTKQIHDVAIGIESAITKMGGKPETIYSDNEGAFVSNEIQRYFKNNNIRHLTTLTHAPVAERSIRTIKNMIYPRVEKTRQKWYDILYPVLLTYNNKLVSHVTHHTPNEARKDSNIFNVKVNLELHAKHTRKYPNVNVGDNVKVYRKKDKLDKERLSLWSKEVYKVERIDINDGQQFYKLEGKPRLLMRHELLLIN